MATFTIKVKSSDFIKPLVQEVPIIQKYLEDVMARVVKRLAEEVAQPIAQDNFGYDGEVQVYTEKVHNGYAIIAEGEQVCFLEFGAGVDTDATHPFAGKVPFMVRAGSWSSSPQGWKQFSTKGYWVHDGETYTGIEPRRGMYEAYKAILENINWILAEELEK